MEIELKTLKDLKRYCHRNTARKTITSSQNQIRVVDYNELKAEAVKWVKAMPCNTPALEVTPYWIKHFFNLTEEDLK